MKSVKLLLRDLQKQKNFLNKNVKKDFWRKIESIGGENVKRREQTLKHIHTESASHSACKLFHIARTDKYTQNDVELSVLTSIHVNTVD